ncbi:hypothetical protein GYMLUDRAFT_64606 [Collybiopsis luxurians FD-317 M1]|uniref:Tubulin-specific chaperone A n=1 Tax=Collybiopsis luxurians FD-317 M1 TaxID=944289 RepID=A0A0D0BBP7_9AGAR|nr:hypothetical protein GYMLUDRAFT_64606 [Collybiopsis luxurians FD-317 M1]
MAISNPTTSVAEQTISGQSKHSRSKAVEDSMMLQRFQDVLHDQAVPLHKRLAKPSLSEYEVAEDQVELEKVGEKLGKTTEALQKLEWLVGAKDQEDYCKKAADPFLTLCINLQVLMIHSHEKLIACKFEYHRIEWTFRC